MSFIESLLFLINLAIKNLAEEFANLLRRKFPLNITMTLI